MSVAATVPGTGKPHGLAHRVASQIRTITRVGAGTGGAVRRRMLRTNLLLATALVTFAGCADTPGADDVAGGGGKADGTLTTVKFTETFSETATGPIVAGSAIRIDYDLDRLTECRGSTNGSEVWSVTGHAKFGTTVTEFALTRLDSGRVVPLKPELEIPSTATSVELWFTNNNRWGCNAYDSNDGANYAFDVEARAGGGAVLAFDADFSESQSDALHAGDSVVIHYAPERLSQCAGSTGGRAAWGITGFYQVDGGTPKAVLVARAEGSTLVASDPTITVPRGSDLAVWFEATSVWGCHAVDTDYGANYHFDIE